MKRMYLTLAIAFVFASAPFYAGRTQAQMPVIAPKANLYVSSFRLVQNAGRWSLTVGVGNNGPGPLASAPCSLKMERYTPVTILGRPGYAVMTTTQPLIAVPAFTLDMVTVVFDLGTVKPKGWAEFTVDSANIVLETNETDNTQNYYFP